MKPIYQTRFGSPFGNCWEACLSTITEIPLEEIPDRRDPARGITERDPYGEMVWWLSTKGWALVYLEWSGESGAILVPKGAHYIVTGTVAGGLDHCVVGKDGRIVHDPHEGWNGAGIVGVYAVEWLFPCSSPPVEGVGYQRPPRNL